LCGLPDSCSSLLDLPATSRQARIGGAAKFEMVVRGSPAFATLLEPAAAHSVAAAAPGTIRVTATRASGEPVRFLFDLRGETGRWETDGVRIEC
jgi:hypothetical protein